VGGEDEDSIARVFDLGVAYTLNADTEITAGCPGRIGCYRPGIGSRSDASN
jgi:hypothetical protein